MKDDSRNIRVCQFKMERCTKNSGISFPVCAEFRYL